MEQDMNPQETYILKYWRNGVEKWDWIGRYHGETGLTDRIQELRERGELPVLIFPVGDKFRVEK